MKSSKYIFLFLCIFFTHIILVRAQSTITISTGSDLKDAIVYLNTSSGQEASGNNNYGTYPRLSATAWTSGSPTFWRTLMHFNVSTIPSGSTIESATLYLYSDPTVTGTSAYNGNSQLSGSNAFFIEKVTQSWNDASVTWNTQPSSTATGRVWVGPSTSTTENIQVDISSMVQDWLDNPSANHGIMFILENEVHYRSRNYGSTDHANSSIHPKLEITYSGPASTGDDNHNYVKSTDVRQSGLSTLSDIETAPSNQKNIQFAYHDGLGRPMQSVQMKASPSQKDIVQAIVYDQFGREETKYLPYASSASNGMYESDPVGLASGDYTSSPHYLFYTNNSNNNADKIANDGAAYSRTIFDSSPRNRVLKQGAPGADWQPNENYTSADNAVVYEYATNGIDEVYEWEITDLGDCKLTSNQFYDLNELYVTVTKDENWTSGIDGTVREYKDKQGRVVLKRTYESGDPHDTYYVYDDFGNLRVVLPPEAIKQLATAISGISENQVITSSQQLTSTTGIFYYTPGVTVTLPPTRTYTPGFEIKPYPVDAELVDQYLFTYKYDQRQRMVEKKVSGTAPVYMVYDTRDRLVLTQDGNQRKSDQWTFTKYDQLNRPVLTGIYTDNTNTDRDAIQTVVDNLSTPLYETRNGTWTGGDHGYTDQSYPTGIGEYDYLSVTYYDDYAFTAGDTDFAFNSSNSVNNGPYLTAPKGQSTGGKVKVLGDNEFLKSATYYDNKYRVIQTHADHYNNDTQDSFTEYDFVGQVLKSKLAYHDGAETIDMTEEFEYDHTGRLLKAWHQMNDQERVLTIENEYNELGELVDKKLHYNPEAEAYTQSVDYRYNIRGWLSTINNASRTSEAGVNDETDDLFGMNLLYNTDPLGVGATAQYNGNISGMAWSNASYIGTQKAYDFAYDKLNRLKDANYKEKTSTSWTVNTGHFSVTGIDYDRNGNIELLNRKESNTTIDALDYDYEGNRLLSVDDTQNNPSGFKDGEESSEEYLYDDNGNMITDRNKEIANIDYNLLNLPEKITFENGDYLEYIYDAGGIKLAKKVYDDGAAPTKETKYVAGMIFENDTLKTIQTTEGRIAAELVANDYTYDYQYYLKDHLGNNRVVFKSDEIVYLATLESEYETTEEAEFKNLDKTRENNSTYNITSPTSEVSNPNKSAMLNSHLLNTDGTRRIVGPAKGLKVYPGDVIDMEVYARYTQVNTSEVSATTFLFAAMTASFGITSGDNPQVYNAFNSFIGGTALINQNPGEVPKAFLNYIFFDKNYENPQFGFDQVSSAGSGGHDLLTLNKTITEEGYMYIYVSNESTLNVNVYFDDLKITHTSLDKVVQANDYYPFGLTMKSSDFKRDGELGNDFLYQGKEIQSDLGLDTYDFHARMYDPALGRTFQQDPHSENYYNLSSYSWVANNPLNVVDPDGRDFRVKTETDEEKKTGTITISTTIHVIGSEKDQKKVDSYNNHAKKKLEDGTFEQDGVTYTVNFDVNYVLAEKAPEELADGDNVLILVDGNAGVSQVPGREKSNGDGTSTFYTGNKGHISKQDQTKAVTLHETMHFLGLTDRYDEVENTNPRQTTPHKGFSNDIMGSRTSGKISQIHYNNWGKAALKKVNGTIRTRVDLDKHGKLIGGTK